MESRTNAELVAPLLGRAEAVKCRATNRQGVRCGRWAIPGGAVCPMHGGSAPQVREAARRRLLTDVELAIEELKRLALRADSEAVRARALGDWLDRCGLKAAEELVVTPAVDTNARLDAAILGALAARGVVVDVAAEADDQDAHSLIALPEASDLH